MEINITDNYTEIYSNNWITENYATNFHNFYKRKILTENESVDDFKEVTEAKKTELENQDAKWERPPQSFIDQWNNACGSWGGIMKILGILS